MGTLRATGLGGAPAEAGADLGEAGAAVEGDLAFSPGRGAQLYGAAALGGGLGQGVLEHLHSGAAAAVGRGNEHFLDDGVAALRSQRLEVGDGADGYGLACGISGDFAEDDEAGIAAGYQVVEYGGHCLGWRGCAAEFGE